MREFKPGDVIDGLVIKEPIGRGGMGTVYLAHDPRLNVDRALKIVSLKGPGFTGSNAERDFYRARFEREAKNLARLRHPNIISIHGTGDIDGHPYLVMSHFPSLDARAFSKAEKPSLERIRLVALHVARGLAHAHSEGVLHRDIKLTNILVGKNDEAMLIDFGLAKAAGDADLTRTGSTMGTYAYLAPEYVRESMAGMPKHTVATDLWALGCVLYALLSGELAFRETNDIRLLRSIAKCRFTPLKEKAPHVPDAWADLVHGLLEPVVERRIKTASDVVARLEALANPAVPPTPPVAQAVPVHLPEAQQASPARVADGARTSEPAPSKSPAILTEDFDLDVVVDNPDESSIMEHTGDAAIATAANGATLEVDELLAQPSFRAPPQNDDGARKSAKRALLLPLAASLTVLAGGATLILVAGHYAQAHKRTTTYLDPEIVERERRAKSEVDEIDRERERSRSTTNTPTPPLSSTFSSFFKPERADDAAPLAPLQRTGRKATATPQRQPAPTAPVTDPALDPWLSRYGSRRSFNTSSIETTQASIVGAAAIAPSLAKPAASGIRVAVHLVDAAASAPMGPVIAYVDNATMLGDVELPRGAEIHGRVAGASGPRLLIDFTFAIAAGKRVELKGTALGADGRPGVPGKKNLGAGSDIGAAAAAGAAQALVSAAAAVVPNDVARGAIVGAGSSVTAKTSRIDNEEDLVVTGKGVHFFVYVDIVG